MKSKPLISILLCVYNGEKYLDECMKSILEQTYKNWELVLINDGSNDNSLKILKSNDHLYDYLLSFKKNRGKGFACKKGIEISNGKFIL